MLNEALLEPLLRLYRIKMVDRYIKHATILFDIGCGPKAVLLNRMRSKIKFGIGYDNRVENSSFKNIYLCKSNIKDVLPVKNKKIDTITMLAVLEHLDDPLPILKECYRILKSDGQLLLTTPTPYAKRLIEFLSYKLGWIDEREVREHKNYFSINEIKDILVEAGFKRSMILAKRFQFFLNNFCLAKK